MKDGIYVSRCQLITALLLAIFVVVAVGLMAGLIRPSCPEYVPGTDPDQPSVQNEPWLEPFLPDYIHPVHYEMWFNPDFYYDGSTFEGRETIELRIENDTMYLLVHFKAMEISLSRVTDSEGTELGIAQTFAYDPNEVWVVEMEEVIQADTTVFLYLEFSGSLVNGIVGYYKSTYTNSLTGQER